MDRVSKSYISKFFLTLSTPVFLITAFLAVSETFTMFLEVFSEDFWRLLTTF